MMGCGGVSRQANEQKIISNAKEKAKAKEDGTDPTTVRLFFALYRYIEDAHCLHSNLELITCGLRL